jgi:uncharacterized protein (TIGR03086 family)
VVAQQPLDLLERALRQATNVMERVADSDLDSPTPCRSWDLRALTNHFIHDLDTFTLAASGKRPDYAAAPPEIDSDRGEVFRTRGAALLEVWRTSGDLDRTMTLPIGEAPAAFVLNMQVAELAMHAWDVATATGQKVDWDDDVATRALEWVRSALKPEFRGDEADGKSFGPEVAAPPQASAQERLVAFSGRSVG